MLHAQYLPTVTNNDWNLNDSCLTALGLQHNAPSTYNFDTVVSNLLSRSNTFDFTNFSLDTGDTSDTPNRNFKVNYDMSRRNSKGVMTEGVQITTLTHGLRGDGSHWSNAGTTDFAYSPDSIISKLSDNGKRANVYWAKVKADDYKDFDLYDITYTRGNYEDEKEDKKVDKVDPSRHIIIVFEAAFAVRPDSDNYLYDSHNRIYYPLTYPPLTSEII